jgi:hypothetical protein
MSFARAGHKLTLAPIMKNLALIPLVILSLFPRIDVGLKIPFTDSNLWTWLVLLFIFAGVSVLLFRVHLAVKIISLVALFSCFLTTTPFISQFAYMEIVACLYFYILCLKITNWRKVANTLWILLGMNILLMVMQVFHKDSLLNFGGNASYGVVGNLMRLKSLLVIISAFLITLYKPKINKWLLAGLVALGVAYFIQHRVSQTFMYARGPVWWETIKLSMKHPFIGWGIGSYKVIFHNIAKGTFTAEGAWMTAHNDFLQILFETGIIGLGVMVAFMARLFSKARGAILLGLTLVTLSMLVHFPMRQISCVAMLIMYFSYLEKELA